MFMLDIETTGLDKKHDDVLEIAMLRLEYEGGLFVPNNHHCIILPTQKEPSEFAKKSPAQLELYEKCHNLDQRVRSLVDQSDPVNAVPEELDFCAATVRGHVVAFLGPKARIVGINVTTFDLPFLAAKDYLRESDYHYQVFDMTGIIELILRVERLPDDRATRDALKNRAKELGANTVGMPEGGAHTGVFDCYDQVRELNGYILAARHSGGGFNHLTRSPE